MSERTIVSIFLGLIFISSGSVNFFIVDKEYTMKFTIFVDFLFDSIRFIVDNIIFEMIIVVFNIEEIVTETAYFIEVKILVK